MARLARLGEVQLASSSTPRAADTRGKNVKMRESEVLARSGQCSSESEAQSEAFVNETPGRSERTLASCHCYSGAFSSHCQHNTGRFGEFVVQKYFGSTGPVASQT